MARKREGDERPPKLDIPVGVAAGDEPAMLLPDGKRNPEHLRWAIRTINKLNMDVARGICEMPRGYNLAQAKELIEAEAKLNGYDPKHLMDVRTDAQIFADSTEELLRTPDDIFASADSFLDQIEKQMDEADKHCRALIGTSSGEARTVIEERAIDRRHEAAKKAWRGRIRKLKTLRSRARLPFPPGHANRDSHAIRAAHVLRFMVYTGRSSKSGKPDIFKIGFHHAKMAVAIYEAKNKIRFHDYQFMQTETDSVLLICPPGHSKTTIAAHWVVLEIDHNPATMGLIGHAQSGVAEQDLAYVVSYFDRDHAQARRNRSLFPKVPEIRKSNTDTFDLHDIGDEKKRQPTIKAYGMTGKISGVDALWIWFDDPCDQELAEQETVRKRVFDRMNATWRARKRGDAFEITTTTLWHHDDPNMKRYIMARDRKIKNLRVSRQFCGGPDDNFKQLWDEIPPSTLRRIYSEWRNPRLYAAAYQSDPQPDSLRKIKRLAYYDPTAADHREFMQACLFHISLDPTATNREKSDHASFVYAGCGDIKVKSTEGSTQFQRRLRFIDGREFHANQTEGVEEVCAYAEANPTHYVHAEIVSAFEATREMFEAKGLDIIPHRPEGNKNKTIRLGHIAPMLDDSLFDKGFPHAVVEFPGKVLPDGSIGPDPESPLAWLEDQILNFGVAKGDHGVDALVYLCKYLGPELSVGTGAVTEILREQRREGTDERIASHLAGFRRPKFRRPEDEDTEFFSVEDN